MGEKSYSEVQSFLENNVKQVIYASLLDLNYLQTHSDLAVAERQAQLAAIERHLSQCLQDIDGYLESRRR